jgi:hypothetical protein
VVEKKGNATGCSEWTTKRGAAPEDAVAHGRARGSCEQCQCSGARRRQVNGDDGRGFEEGARQHLPPCLHLSGLRCAPAGGRKRGSTRRHVACTWRRIGPRKGGSAWVLADGEQRPRLATPWTSCRAPQLRHAPGPPPEVSRGASSSAQHACSRSTCTLQRRHCCSQGAPVLPCKYNHRPSRSLAVHGSAVALDLPIVGACCGWHGGVHAGWVRAWQPRQRSMLGRARIIPTTACRWHPYQPLAGAASSACCEPRMLQAPCFALDRRSTHPQSRIAMCQQLGPDRVFPLLAGASTPCLSLP